MQLNGEKLKRRAAGGIINRRHQVNLPDGGGEEAAAAVVVGLFAIFFLIFLNMILIFVLRKKKSCVRLPRVDDVSKRYDWPRFLKHFDSAAGDCGKGVRSSKYGTST